MVLVRSSKILCVRGGKPCVFLVMLDVEAPLNGGLGALVFLAISSSEISTAGRTCSGQ